MWLDTVQFNKECTVCSLEFQKYEKRSCILLVSMAERSAPYEVSSPEGHLEFKMRTSGTLEISLGEDVEKGSIHIS